MKAKELFALEISSDLNTSALTRRLNDLTNELKKHLRSPKTVLEIVVLRVRDRK